MRYSPQVAVTTGVVDPDICTGFFLPSTLEEERVVDDGRATVGPLTDDDLELCCWVEEVQPVAVADFLCGCRGAVDESSRLGLPKTLHIILGKDRA